jgi:DNA-binding NarL/FixJ family response regulator
MKRRVLVADTQPLAICGLEAVLSATDDFQVVRTVNDLTQVEAALGETDADLIVIELDGMSYSPSFFMQLRRLQPELKIVAVGAPGDPALIRTAFAMGADGYHVRTVTTEELLAGLRRILLATEFTPIGAAREFPTSAAPLTSRELVILEAVSRGLSNKRIASELWVTEQTVKFHLANTFRKLGVSNRTAAARAGQRLGLLSLSLISAQI